MADTEVSPSQADTDFGAPAGGGGPGAWIAQHKGAAAGAGLVLLVALYFYLKRRQQASSGSSGSVGTSTGPAVYEIAPGYLQGGGAGAYGSSIGWDQALAGQVQTGQTGGQVSGTGAPSSGASTAGSVNANASGIPGWMKIGTPAEGSAYDAAGRTIDVLPGGATPSASALIPFASGGKIVNRGPFPAGSSQWVQTG